MSDVVIALIWLGVTAYAVFGGADFGAGMWDLLAGSQEKGEKPRGLIDVAITPVWEANHVWIIFVLVLTWTGFPDAFASIMSTLWIPFALALVGIVFRGSGFAFGHFLTGRAHWAASRAFGLASVLTPFFLGAALGGIASGRVPLYPAEGDPFTSWFNPTSLVVGVLAVVTCAYLAAVFLVADADRVGDAELREYFARRATIAAAVAGPVAVAGLFVMRSDAAYVADRLTDQWLALLLLAVSLVAGGANLFLLHRRARRLTRAVGVAAVVAIVWGWAVAQYPYLLPKSLTISAGAAGDPTLQWLLIVAGLAVLTVGPSLALLFTLDRRSLLVKDAS